MLIWCMFWFLEILRKKKNKILVTIKYRSDFSYLMELWSFLVVAVKWFYNKIKGSLKNEVNVWSRSLFQVHLYLKRKQVFGEICQCKFEFILAKKNKKTLDRNWASNQCFLLYNDFKNYKRMFVKKGIWTKSGTSK